MDNHEIQAIILGTQDTEQRRQSKQKTQHRKLTRRNDSCLFIFIKVYFISLFIQGIVRALREFQQKLIEGSVSIYVRRAGPNYQEGLRIMRELGKVWSNVLDLNILWSFKVLLNLFFRDYLFCQLNEIWPLILVNWYDGIILMLISVRISRKTDGKF